MKKHYLLLTFFVLITAGVVAQRGKPPVKFMDLVVEIPKSDSGKTWNGLSETLNNMKNVSVEGYCPSQKLLYLRLDPTEYFNVLVAINEAGFTYYLRKDNLSKGIEACLDKKDLYLRESSDVY